MTRPEEIRTFREAHPGENGDPMPQWRLAELLELPDPRRGGQVTISRWEAGRHPPPPFLWRALRDIDTHDDHLEAAMTQDYQTYQTEDQARTAVAEMRGWPDAEVGQIYLPDHPDADGEGSVWVVRADERRYLRQDGYVR